MSQTVEQRVVSMQFKGEQFLAGVEKSMTQLDKFTAKLKSANGTKAFDQTGAAAARQSNALQSVANDVSRISERFKAMGVVGVAALSNITNQAIYAGQNLIKSLSLDSLTKGFNEYETNINSIQTILGNTKAAFSDLSDVEHLKRVSGSLEQLNKYSDQTIYNFSEMAKNIGMFTAAGVDLDTSVASIKGIANLAALSGTSSEKAAGAMYQLSQAISSGTVTLEDWNSVQSASMDGAIFKKALADTAVAMGVLKKGAVTLEGPMKNITVNGEAFRKSISSAGGKQSWLTSEVLVNTLKQFSGDLTDAQLKAMNFDQTQRKAIMSQAKMAQDAATQVKTFSALMDTTKEQLGSGWSNTWKLIFGDFMEAKGLFTGISNTIGKMVEHSAGARNKMLTDWREAGGRTALIKGLSNAFDALLGFLKPIGEAWRTAFPATTGKQLANYSKSFAEFTKNLKPSVETARNLKRTFAGVFAIFGIGFDVLKGFVGMIGRLVGVAFDGSGGFLEFTANIGDFLVNLRKAIQDGKGITNVFKGIGDVLAVPLRAFSMFSDALAKAFDDKNTGTQLIKAVGEISKRVEPMGQQAEHIASAWEKVLNTLKAVWKRVEAIGSWIVEKFAGVGRFIADLFSGLDFDDVTKALNTGLFATLVVFLKQWLDGSGGGGFMEAFTESIEGLTGALRGMQFALNAGAILGIAIAIGILAVSLNVLSKIDSQGLARGTAAMTGLFTQLATTVILVEKFTAFTGVAKLPAIALAMVGLAVAIGILAFAMKLLATMSWEDIAKGLAGTTGLMATMVAVMVAMPKTKSFILSAISMTIMALGINLLADAVAELAGLGWEEMARGLAGVAALMTALMIFANATKFNLKGAVSGIVILLMAQAIKTLSKALAEVSKLGWEEMSRGLALTAAGLILISAALKFIPPSAIFSAAGVLLVALALQMIQDAFAKGAGMSWEQIGRGMAVMGGSLVILAGALKLMAGSLRGAIALAITAGSLQLLSLSLEANSKLGWDAIAKGMAVVAGSLVLLTAALYAMGHPMAERGSWAILGAAGALAVIGPVMEALSKLGWSGVLIALTALAGVFIILGAAAYLLGPVLPVIYGLGTSLALMGVGILAVGAGLALFGLGITLAASGLALLATSGVAAATAIVGMVSVILGGLPTIIELINKTVQAILQLIIDSGPKLFEAIVTILGAILDAIVKLSPKIAEAFLVLLEAVLRILVEGVPRIAEAALKLVRALLDVLINHVGEMSQKGVDLIVGFLNGIANNLGRVITAGTNILIALIRGLTANAVRLADEGFKAVVTFLNGVANSIRANSAAMRSAGLNIASAIIDGLTGGLFSGVSRVTGAAKSVAQSALDAAMRVLDVNSPSKEFYKIGKYVVEGFRLGIDGNKKQIDTVFNDLKTKISDLYKSANEDIDKLTAKLKKLKSARNKDKKAIKETTAALKQAKTEKAAAIAAQKYMKTLKDEQAQLGKLAGKYDQVTAKLEKAQEAYANAVKTRDDYNKSINDDYGNALDPTGEMTATGYIEDLKKQLEDTKTFTNTIQQLRKLGLNDETYKDLLSSGVDALPFMKDLLKGGKTQIDQVNQLNKELDGVASSLGQTASSQLYQAAVNSAKGLVDGLKKEQANIEKQMDKIADAMVKAIKKKLGIKSPSRVFAEVGKFTTAGLIEGLDKNAAQVATAASSMGDQAVKAIRVSLSGMDKMVTGNIDVQPTIRPVLDLTDIQRNAGKLSGLLPSAQKMSIAGSYSLATKVATSMRDRQLAETIDGDDGGVNLTYIQTINSPKAVTPAEVYRGTKNQLSTVKGALST